MGGIGNEGWGEYGKGGVGEIVVNEGRGRIWKRGGGRIWEMRVAGEYNFYW